MPHPRPPARRLACSQGRRDGGSSDEPYAWEAREALRELCIGKEVTFKVDYAVPSINREFGTVFVGQESAAMHLVQRGLAKVRAANPASPSHQSPMYDQLAAAEAKAIAAGVGMHTKDQAAKQKAVRGKPAPFDAKAACAGSDAPEGAKPIKAIVESVVNAGCMRVTLLPGFQSQMVYLAGVQAPSMGRKARPATSGEGGEEGAKDGAKEGGREATAPEPLAPEAKHFVESRVLQRDVTIVPEGVDKYDNLLVTLLFAEGAGSGCGKEHATGLAQQVLGAGLGKIAEWSAAMLQPLRRERLRSSERTAKAGRLGLWKAYAPPQAAAAAAGGGAFGSRRSFMAEVAEVVSGDMVSIRDPATGAEARVALASIRAPRVGNPRKEGDVGQPHGKEAKEFLRTRLIGVGPVKVDIEYTRKVGGNKDAAVPGKTESASEERTMTYATITLKSGGAKEDSNGAQQGGANVAEMAVMRGLATVINHRGDDERSSHYEALLTAQDRAKKGKKGVWSSKEQAPERINDMSSAGSQQSRSFLPFLQRAGKLPCVVDHVISAHRLKVRCERESCVFIVALAGVRAPARGEKGSNEALMLARKLAMQRDVLVSVEGADKTGTFLGTVEVLSKQQASSKGAAASGQARSGSSVSAGLVKAGLCRLVGPESRRDPVLAGLEAAAKEKRLGMWENWTDESAAEAAAAKAAETERTKGPQAYKAHVMELVSGSMCYLRLEGPAGGETDGKHAADVAAVSEGLAKLSAAEGFAPAAGATCAGRFTADDQWYRVAIDRVDKAALAAGGDPAAYECFFIDFGNSEKLPASRLAPLPASAVSVPPLAQPAVLDALKVPSLEEDYGHEAAQLVADLTMGKELKCVVEDRQRAVDAGLSRARQGRGTLLRVTLSEAAAAASPSKPKEDADDEGEIEEEEEAAEGEEPTVNAALLQAGLARVDERALRRRPKVKEALLEHQEQAKRARRAMWVYGDAGSDDDL